MSDLNSVTITGRLVRDPENKTFESGKNACNFTLAVNHKYAGNEDTSFIRCVAFSKIGQLIADKCKKGERIGVSGRLTQKTWQSYQGKREAIEIIVGDVMFLGGGKPMNSDYPDAVPTESHEVPF